MKTAVYLFMLGFLISFGSAEASENELRLATYLEKEAETILKPFQKGSDFSVRMELEFKPSKKENRPDDRFTLPLSTEEWMLKKLSAPEARRHYLDEIARLKRITVVILSAQTISETSRAELLGHLRSRTGLSVKQIKLNSKLLEGPKTETSGTLDFLKQNFGFLFLGACVVIASIVGMAFAKAPLPETSALPKDMGQHVSGDARVGVDLNSGHLPETKEVSSDISVFRVSDSKAKELFLRDSFFSPELSSFFFEYAIVDTECAKKLGDSPASVEQMKALQRNQKSAMTMALQSQALSFYKDHYIDYLEKSFYSESYSKLLGLGPRLLRAHFEELELHGKLFIALRSTPLFKTFILGLLSTKDKLQLLKNPELGASSGEDRGRFEALCAELYQKISRQSTVTALAPLQVEAMSFAEDEELYDAARAENYPYRSPLNLLDTLDVVKAQSLSVKLLADVFFGYGPETQLRLGSFFSPEKRKWLEHFMNENRALKKDFLDKEIRTSRSLFLETLTLVLVKEEKKPRLVA